MSRDSAYFIGVDVGTQSVRASLVHASGDVICTATHPLTVHNPAPDHYEQSCTEIWSAVTAVVTQLQSDCTDDWQGNIAGIGFDATCSMVVVDAAGEPLCVSVNQTAHPDNTCLMWMDHRAEREAEEINRCGSEVLKYVGGSFSPEQQPPKLLWLKRYLPEVWAKAEHFFDLPDWLTYKATGRTTRSLCSVACKWGYVAHRGQWDVNFLVQIGLSDLCDLEKLGNDVRSPGDDIGVLQEGVCEQLHLPPSTRVAVSMIDAHAGALAMLRYSDTDICKTLGVISGTSTCIMGLCESAELVDGVWGPYKGLWGPYQGVVLPGLWLYEGGQTAAGSALDHIVQSHPASKFGMDYAGFNTDLCSRAKCLLTDAQLHRRSQHVHIQPDIHGNRSPLAIPWFRGVISGLDLNSDYDNLLTTYLAAVQGLALGVCFIVESMVEKGLSFNRIVVCGGLADNPLYLCILATVTRLPVIKAPSNNMMCVGSSILAQRAATSETLWTILADDRAESNILERHDPLPDLFSFYDAKYEVYKKMTLCQNEFRQIMQNA